MNTNRPNQPSLSKAELHELADSLVMQEQWGIDRCVDFVLSETHGLWHGRARALMCRRLKYCPLCRAHQTRLVNCILARLSAGNFSEQFKDQLRLALHFDPESVFKIASQLLSSPKRHVAKYAQWILLHENQ